MATKRDLKTHEPTSTFFNVRVDNIYTANHTFIPGYKAIIDEQRNRTMSIVSSNYHLVTNEDAFNIAKYIVPKVFHGKSIDDFKVFNIRMPMTRSWCIIDLIIPSASRALNGFSSDCYTPYLRITNSYNRTCTLSYEIGFCRSICMNGCIFGNVGIKITANHSDNRALRNIDCFIDENRSKLTDVEYLWKNVETMLQKAREIEINESQIIPIYCKAFNVKLDINNVTDRQKGIYASRGKRLLNDGKAYFDELGHNGYAMYNILSDYASYPEEGEPYIRRAQSRVGEWLVEFTKACSKDAFSVESYIKDELSVGNFIQSLALTPASINTPREILPLPNF